LIPEDLDAHTADLGLQEDDEMNDELPFNVTEMQVEPNPVAIECAECHELLVNRLYRWDHMQPADHEPVPVPVTEARP
jgi:hypothetical protein